MTYKSTNRGQLVSAVLGWGRSRTDTVASPYCCPTPPVSPKACRDGPVATTFAWNCEGFPSKISFFWQNSGWKHGFSVLFPKKMASTMAATTKRRCLGRLLKNHYNKLTLQSSEPIHVTLETRLVMKGCRLLDGRKILPDVSHRALVTAFQSKREYPYWKIILIPLM